MALSDLFTKCVTIVDDVLDSSLLVNADAVIASDNTNNVCEATLWRTAIFDPWCEGTFGDKYEHLFTLYSDLEDGQSAMKQSNDDVLTIWDDGGIHYNSKSITRS